MTVATASRADGSALLIASLVDEDLGELGPSLSETHVRGSELFGEEGTKTSTPVRPYRHQALTVSWRKTAEGSGYREVGEAGGLFYRARYYQPGIGRFTQEDPVGLLAGPNVYTYVNNSPTQYFDPQGLAPGCCDCPEGLWGYKGVSTGIGLIGGKSAFKGTFTCKSAPAVQMDVEGTCKLGGYFAGVNFWSRDFSITPLGIPGAKACNKKDLLAPSTVTFFGSIGPLTVNGGGGAGLFSIGVQVGGGIGIQECSTRSASPPLPGAE